MQYCLEVKQCRATSTLEARKELLWPKFGSCGVHSWEANLTSRHPFLHSVVFLKLRYVNVMWTCKYLSSKKLSRYTNNLIIIRFAVIVFNIFKPLNFTLFPLTVLKELLFYTSVILQSSTFSSTKEYISELPEKQFFRYFPSVYHLSYVSAPGNNFPKDFSLSDFVFTFMALSMFYAQLLTALSPPLKDNVKKKKCPQHVSKNYTLLRVTSTLLKILSLSIIKESSYTKLL